MYRYTSIAIVILFILLIPAQAFAATAQTKLTLLTIEEAVELGTKLDVGVIEARNNLSQKRTEWKQSVQSIISEAQKDASPFARPHNLSKDLNIRMKLPEARKSLVEASENLVKQNDIASNEVRNLYINVISMMNSVSEAEKALLSSGSKLNEVKTLVKLSKAQQSDVEKAEDAKKSAESDLKQAKLSYKSVLLQLSKTIGLDVEQGYTFELQPVYADLQADVIWKLISHAEHNDSSLSAATMNRSLAEEKVRVTRQLYEAKFGSADMKIIESMFKKEINEQLFEANHESFLERVSKQWDGYITIVIPFPKSLFQGEFDGIRYFDDQRYSLPISLFEQNKARKKEQDTLEQLLTGIKTSFLSVKAAEESYSQALQALEMVKKELTSANTKLKVKQITKSQYSEIEDKVNDANQAVMNAYLSYYSSVFKLDLDTSGGIRPFMKKGILPWRAIDDGLSPINASVKQNKPFVGSFTIKPVVEPITGSLSMDVDPSLGATHYKLFTQDHVPLSEKIQVGQPLVVLQLLLQSITEYQVVFYKQQAVVAQATFAGIGTSGSLVIEEISSFDEKLAPAGSLKPSTDPGTVIMGTFKIALPQLTKEVATIALTTATQSGQGIYYQPSGTTDWFDLEKTLDYQDIVSGVKTVIVHKDRIDALNLTVSLDAAGHITSLQTSDQLQGDMNNIQLLVDQLQIEADEARESGQFTQLAQILQEIDISVSKKAFLESLLLGDNGKAMSQIAEWSSAQLGEAPSPDGGDNTQVYETKSNKLNDELKSAMEAGNADEILKLATQYVDALTAQLSEQQGVTQDIEALFEAETRLEAAKDKAEQANDGEQAQAMLLALEVIQADIIIAQKQHLFVQKHALQLVIDMLSEQKHPHNELDAQKSEVIMAIIDAEKAKYDEQELIAVSEAADKIIELHGEDVQPIPVQHIISSAFDIKFDMPPVFTDGQAMIQIRPISESFGALVVWNDDDQSVTITKNGIVITCKVGESTAYVDGQAFIMEAAPQLLLGKRVVVPLRFVAMSLGIEVDWDIQSQTIELSGKGDIQQ